MPETPKLGSVMVDGHELAFKRAGAGSPVVFIHGIVSSSFIWDQIALDLSSDYDVIWLDLLGCGGSGKPLDADYSIRAHAARLKEFTSQLNLNRFHLVGHDVGGGIAQIYAVHHTEDLLNLTLINTIAYDFWPVQPIIAMRTPIIRNLAMATLDLGVLKKLIQLAVYHKERITEEVMEQFSAQFRTREGRKAFLKFAKSLDSDHLLEISDDLGKLDIPVLILRGEEDVFLSGTIAEELHANIPDSRLESIDTGGHYIQYDEPEWVVRNLRSFMEGDGRGPEF